jgi:hypothetical protein
MWTRARWDAHVAIRGHVTIVVVNIFEPTIRMPDWAILIFVRVTCSQPVNFLEENQDANPPDRAICAVGLLVPSALAANVLAQQPRQQPEASLTKLRESYLQRRGGNARSTIGSQNRRTSWSTGQW